MDVTKDALELIQATARKAADAKVLDLPSDGRKAHIAINGELKEISLKPARRAHIVRTLEALASYGLVAARSLSDGLVAARSLSEVDVHGMPVVFHNTEACVLLVNDMDRRDTVTLPLSLSDQWNLLRKWEVEKPALSQREVIQALRFVFNTSPATINAFRRIDLKTAQAAQMAMDRGRESLGRQVEAQIINAADIPETIILSAPIYTNLGENSPYEVPCAVEIDASCGRVQIVPEPLLLDKIMHRHQSGIAERLDEAFSELDSGIDVYYGCP